MRKMLSYLSIIIGIAVMLLVTVFPVALPMSSVFALASLGLVSALVGFKVSKISAIIGVMLNLYTLMFLGLFFT